MRHTSDIAADTDVHAGARELRHAALGVAAAEHL
jgi:hypothetical protein